MLWLTVSDGNSVLSPLPLRPPPPPRLPCTPSSATAVDHRPRRRHPARLSPRAERSPASGRPAGAACSSCGLLPRLSASPHHLAQVILATAELPQNRGRRSARKFSRNAPLMFSVSSSVFSSSSPFVWSALPSGTPSAVHSAVPVRVAHALRFGHLSAAGAPGLELLSSAAPLTVR